MLVVKHIQVKFQKNTIPIKIRNIKAGYKDNYLTTKRKYRQIDTHSFEWFQDMTLPIYYNVPLQFHCSIDPVQENPEGQSLYLKCLMKITDYKKTNEQGAVLNRSNVKVATLFVSYRIINEKMIIPDDKGSVIVSSILAHLDQYFGAKGFIEISIGHKQIFTPTVEVIAGQLLWAEQLSLPVEEVKDSRHRQQIMFKIRVDERVVGVGSFQIESIKKATQKYKKFDIKEVEGGHKKLGTLFMDIVYKHRGAKQQENNVHNVHNVHNFHNVNNQKHMKIHTQPQRKFHKRSNTNQKLLDSHKQLYFKQKNKSVIVSSSKSLRFLPKLGSMDSTPKLMTIQQLNPQQKLRKNKNTDMFNGVFNLGQQDKPQSIRDILRQRRKKKQNPLPKLK